MVCRTRVIVVSLSIGIASLGYGPQPASAEGLSHPGRVVKMGANTPLSVDVKAWPESRQSGEVAGCPLYGETPLDSTRSNESDGQFVLKIEASRPTYTTTYCASEYFPRVERDAPNSEDGSSINPDPVELYSRGTNRADYESIVRNKTTAFLSDLAYLQNVDPKGFDQALKALSDDASRDADFRRNVISGLRELVLEWSNR